MPYLSGAFMFKKNMTKSQIAQFGSDAWGYFYCCGIKCRSIAYTVESNITKLYYIDNVGDYMLVWQEPTQGKSGWVKNAYRCISFEFYEEVDEILYSQISSYADRTFFTTETNVRHKIGLEKVAIGCWVFGNTIDYFFDYSKTIEQTVPFSSNGTKYNTIRISTSESNTALFYGSTRVYSTSKGWENDNYRIINFDEVQYNPSLDIVSFILATASENAVVQREETYIPIFVRGLSSGKQVEIKCNQKHFLRDLSVIVAPCVGICECYYGDVFKASFNIAGRVSDTSKAQKIVFATYKKVATKNIKLKINDK